MIIVDTDFIVNCIKFRIDFVREFKHDYPNEEITVVEKTLDELHMINNPYSRAAIDLIREKKLRIIKTTLNKIADTLILEHAKEGDIVATQDYDLKEKLKERGIKVITIKQKSRLSI